MPNNKLFEWGATSWFEDWPQQRGRNILIDSFADGYDEI